MFNSSTIKKIQARQILDSRGQPTLEVEVITSTGFSGVASVPSGASTGKKEVLELRDGGIAYGGKGVSHAVENVNTAISKALKGFPITDQKAIDEKLIKLDGTPDKHRLGGNATIGVSIACAKAAAASLNLPLYKYFSSLLGVKPAKPRLMMNLINGGLHADDGLAIQEYLFIPEALTIKDAVQVGVEVYHQVARELRLRNIVAGVGDEGGFAPKLKSNTEPFELITSAARELGYEPDKKFNLGIDAAANGFVEHGDKFIYNFKLENKQFTSSELINLYETWISQYKLITIEDGVSEDDLEGWKEMTQRLSGRAHTVSQKIETVGDDLFVTHAKTLIDGARLKIATAIIIKPNQVGTLSETMETVSQAKKLGYVCVASHRSGETNDTFIADLAIGFACEFIKAGAPARGERVAKYNRLLDIERELDQI